jgi:ankyrin repeat protein
MNPRRNQKGITLIEAIIQNDPSAVQFLIDQGANVNARNKKGETPLMKACKIKSSTDIIWYLLQAGADPNIPDNQKDIPARFCLENIELVQLLVEAGTDIHFRDEHERTLLHLSAMADVPTEVLAYLLDVGSEVNAQDGFSDTPLMYACQYKEGLEKTILLLSAGADPNNEDRYGNTVLNRCSPDLMEVLLEAGADINRPNVRYGLTPLQMASFRGYTDGVEKLLQLGADTEIEDSRGNTAINIITQDMPIMYDDTYNEILKLLIEAGANVNHRYHLPDGTRVTMLDYVLKKKNYVALYLLLEAGADPYQVSGGRVPMDLTNCSADVMEAFLKAGVDINRITDAYKPTVLLTASYTGNINCVRKLLELGADTEIEDSRGNTAINIIMDNRPYDPDKYNEILKLLIEAGANVNHMYNYGTRDGRVKSAGMLHYAVLKKNLGALYLLLEAGADPYQVDSEGRVPIEWTDCSADIMEAFLKAGVDINRITDGGKPTVLLAASYTGNINCVRKLLELGADTEIEDSRGNTAINIIMDGVRPYDPDKYNEILKLFIEAGANVNHMYIYGTRGRFAGMLHFAVLKKNLGALYLLLEAGADPYQVDSEGRVPIEWTDCSADIMEAFLKAGVDINRITDGDKPTVLLTASFTGNINCVRKLLELGADTEIEDRRGNTAINIIMDNRPYDPDKYNEILKLFIEAGANVNHMYNYRERDGRVKSAGMLHYAVLKKNLEALYLLLEAGADPYQVDSEGRVPIEWAKSDKEIIMLLLRYMSVLPPQLEQEYGGVHQLFHEYREEAINTLAAEEEIYDPNLQKFILKFL